MGTRNIKLILKLALSFLFLFSTFYFLLSAATAAPSPVPSKNQVATESADLEKIQRIKDIVASKVAELKLVEKRGIIGKVKESSTTQITIEDTKGDLRIIDIDELTKFEGKKDEKEDSFGVSDLDKNTPYSFIGLYNKDTKHLMARIVMTAKTIPVYFEGAVAEVSEDEYQILVVNDKGTKKKVDIERSTKTSSFSEDDTLAKSGFSKLEINERVIVVGYADLKDKDLIAASRIIHFTDIPPSSGMQQYIKLDEKSSTESGKKE